MEAFMEQDVFSVLPTILVPTVIVLAPIAYLMLSNWQKLSGESRGNLRPSRSVWHDDVIVV